MRSPVLDIDVQPSPSGLLEWRNEPTQTKGEISWHHKDGKGQTLQLEVVPINGRIVLREPLENPQAEKESAA